MASAMLRSHYACPCTDISASVPNPTQLATTTAEGTEEEEEQSFNPHSARAKFNLYPLESLLFCNECHEIRCPKCYFEEVLEYHCPSCLFEVDSGAVKRESNRCTRSCYQCPICISPLAINVYQAPDQDETSYILSCPYCSWTSLEVGMQFEKSINITGQLADLRRTRAVEEAVPSTTGRRRSAFSEDTRFSEATKTPVNDQFAALAVFYRNQIVDTAPDESTRQITRRLAKRDIAMLRRQRGRVPVMREALGRDEGLYVDMAVEDEDMIIHRMRTLGWSGVTTVQHREAQASPSTARLYTDLWPLATPLRSRRAKRCRTCRHQLLRLDGDKKQPTKYRIRLVALNYIPRITLKPLDPTPNSSQLIPMKSTYFILTFRNPLSDLVKISLATPRYTPGKVQSRVTLLCPQFDISANAERWDDGLDLPGRGGKDVSAQQGQQAEAGKVWEKGRNWTSVVMEIVPGLLERELVSKLPGDYGHDEDHATLQVPVFVRMEYESEDTGQQADDASLSSASKSDKASEVKVRRELSFWCVMSVGRVEST